MIFFLEIIVLAIVQGLAELLPVSSSAHVIVAEKLMRMKLDPGSPQMALLLVMLHTGTMFAVIVYFWNTWKKTIFGSAGIFKQQAARLIVATALTGAIGYPLILGIQKAAARSGFVQAGANKEVEIEQLFGNLGIISGALAAAGALILVAGLLEPREEIQKRDVDMPTASIIGVVQAICLPLRGFSRSGATISTGMLAGAGKRRVEEFSFALAVLLTPAVVEHELVRVIKQRHVLGHAGHLSGLLGPSLLGMVFAFLAGLVALKWLSSWLENGKWYWFGIYCLVFSVVVAALYVRGF